MKNQIHFLGRPRGKNSLALSTLAIDMNGKRTIIDPGKGMLPLESEEKIVETYGPEMGSIQDGKEIDRIMITHAHMDHMSHAPVLCKQGVLSPDAKIWATPQTNEILGITSLDDLENKETDEFDGFSYFRMTNSLSNISSPGENLIDGEPEYMSPNGHMPGSTSIMLRTPSDRVAMIFGDAC